MSYTQRIRYQDQERQIQAWLKARPDLIPQSDQHLATLINGGVAPPAEAAVAATASGPNAPGKGGSQAGPSGPTRKVLAITNGPVDGSEAAGAAAGTPNSDAGLGDSPAASDDYECAGQMHWPICAELGRKGTMSP